MRAKPILCFGLAGLLLSGCGLPQKVQQTIRDKQIYDQESREKSAYDRCNQDSMPGTMQHFACRLSAEKSAAPAK
jgi:hypothetical protein